MTDEPDPEFELSGDAQPARRPLVIGITGPIGCGKSTVARLLGEVGAVVIDADVLARRATDEGQATLSDIRSRFGDTVFMPNGELDRTRMASVVFDDPEALADLEGIVHPAVRILVEKALENASEEDAPFVVIEAIKLVEGGLAQRCDEVWLLECSPDTQRSRMLARGSTAEDADRRIGAQGRNLGDRLAAMLHGHRDGPRVRRLSTEGSLDATRELMEDALADAFEGGAQRP